MNKPLLEVKNLCVRFGRGKKQFTAADGVTLDIACGETLGLVGESGCGKTTVGRSIMGLYKPTAGEIYYDGNLIKTKKSLIEFRENAAMVFQDPLSAFNPRMTVREIIAEGLKIKGLGDEAEINRRVYETLEKVGLSAGCAARYPHEFSGGQRQRIGIARAIITRPRLIIADEPLSALDVSIQAQIINLLNALKRELNLTILFIAHDLSAVKYFSDRIAVMYAGKIVEVAPSAKLFENPQHPYTQALLSAIPVADPVREKARKRLIFNPQEVSSKQGLIEVAPRHLVLGGKKGKI